MLFAHLKRILRLGPVRLRGANGAKDEGSPVSRHRPKSAETRRSSSLPGADLRHV